MRLSSTYDITSMTLILVLSHDEALIVLSVSCVREAVKYLPPGCDSVPFLVRM